MARRIIFVLTDVGEKMEEIMVGSIIEDKCVCRRCHRKLVDEKSKQLGFGKVCYQKYLKRKKVYLFEMEVLDETITKS